jgi:hypothetical protein
MELPVTTVQKRVLAVTAMVKDVLDALHLPGGETLGALVEKEIEDRNKATLNVLLEELGKARDEGVTFEENDVHDFVQMILRLLDAINKGAARRNLRLMAQVICGQLYKVMQREGDPWSLLKDELVPGTFKTNAELESVCASLLRTGLLPASAFGALVYQATESIKELGALAELESAGSVGI